MAGHTSPLKTIAAAALLSVLATLTSVAAPEPPEHPGSAIAPRDETRADSALEVASAKLFGDLLQVVADAGPEELIPVAIVLADQLTGDRLRAVAAEVRDPDVRRARRAAALREHALGTQGAVRARVEAALVAGRARKIRYLWIGNIVTAELTAGEIEAVAALPSVDHVTWTPKREVFLSGGASSPVDGASACSSPQVNLSHTQLGETPVSHLGEADASSASGSSPATSSTASADESASDYAPSSTGGSVFASVSDSGFASVSNSGFASAGGGGGVGVDEITCGVDLIQAPRVWSELGNTGDGAVIALIDSGVCYTHTDIANQIWVNPGEDLNGNGVVMDAADMNGIDDDGNGYIDDLIGWDVENQDNDPNDGAGHGSHTGGTVAGDGTGGTQAGVAPDAQLMVLRVGGSVSDEGDGWEAMQYAADNGADAISLSMGWSHASNPDRATWRTNVNNTIDLGTAMVIAAGNAGGGNEPDNVTTPGDVPRAITVGAVDCFDGIGWFSGRGPVTWQDVPPWNDHPYPPGLVKPDVAAPGVGVKSHNSCNFYRFEDGTSMATPHVSGAVALMVSANPDLTHDDLKLTLEETAVELGAPGKDNDFGWGRIDAYEAVQRVGSSDGTISIRDDTVPCALPLNITVWDVDLKGAGSVSVEVSSDTEGTPEVLSLAETSAASGMFRGSIPVDEGPPAPDGQIQAVDGDTVIVSYVDADDGLGGLFVTKTDSTLVDCSGPVITDVRATGTTETSTLIEWTTEQIATSRVTYGEQVPPDTAVSDAAYVTAHAVSIDSLTPCTSYVFEVESGDTLGNVTVDDAGGAYHAFTTYGDLGNGAQPCRAARVVIDAATQACTDLVSIRVSELDLNADPGVAETALVEVSSGTEDQPELVVVTETGVDTSLFTGTIATASGAPAADGVLQVAHGDLITATHADADDGSGQAATAYDTALVDCNAPVIGDVRIEAITDQRATVRFVSDKPGDSVVEWGTTPALGQVTTVPGLRTDHAVPVNRLSECGPLYFRVSTTDAHGRTASLDLGGSPFGGWSWLVPGVYWREDFEAGAATWTLGGEWQAGTPAGLGGSSGFADPLGAYNHDGALGTDLTGLGANPGDYEHSVLETAATEQLNAQGWTNTRLLLTRRLNVQRDDQARIVIRAGNQDTLIYSSGAAATNETDWTPLAYNVASTVDGERRVTLKFEMESDASAPSNDDGVSSGWNIDDVIFKDGSQPDYAACGGCATAPSFAGASAAIDNDACAAAGVTVSWPQVATWGSGAGGTVAIYRDTAPGFTPSSANLVASGVSGTSYDDATAPTGQQLYYLVRAESDETCGGGPNNGGAMDGNTSYVAVTATTSQPLPAPHDSLRLDKASGVHVALSWDPAAGATAYRVYRSTEPSGGFAVLDESSELTWMDVGAAADAATYFYLLEGINACGQEAP